MTNTAELQDRIAATGITIVALAKKCGVSRETFYNRLAGKSEFRASEITAITRTLQLNREERDAIFFTE